MALINCSECNKAISDKASSCPNCGAPTGRIQEQETGRISWLRIAQVYVVLVIIRAVVDPTDEGIAYSFGFYLVRPLSGLF